MDYGLNLGKKVVIVTGAASGIGKATALAFVKQKARVVFFDINQVNRSEIKGHDKRDNDILFVQGDVSQQRDVENLVQKTIDAFGRIDILVNNAGIEFNDRGNLVTMPFKDLDRILKVNLYGYMHTVRAVIPKMQRGGKVVNITSVQGLGAHLPGTSYQVSKSGIIGLTRALAIEYGPGGININAIAPGAIATEGMGAVRGGSGLLDPYRKRIPLGRRGWPEEVAGPILFLCSDLANYINGETLVVDGGYLANITPDLGGTPQLQPDDPDK